jgi:hypothetical protein
MAIARSGRSVTVRRGVKVIDHPAERATAGHPAPTVIARLGAMATAGRRAAKGIVRNGRTEIVRRAVTVTAGHLGVMAIADPHAGKATVRREIAHNAAPATVRSGPTEIVRRVATAIAALHAVRVTIARRAAMETAAPHAVRVTIGRPIVPAGRPAAPTGLIARVRISRPPRGPRASNRMRTATRERSA